MKRKRSDPAWRAKVRAALVEEQARQQKDAGEDAQRRARILGKMVKLIDEEARGDDG